MLIPKICNKKPRERTLGFLVELTGLAINGLYHHLFQMPLAVGSP